MNNKFSWLAGIAVLLTLAVIWMVRYRQSAPDAIPEKTEERIGADIPKPELSVAPLMTEADSAIAVPPPEIDASVAPRASRTDSVLDDELQGVDWPPGADAKGMPLIPSPTDDMLRRLSQEIAMGAGPETYDHALRLLEAEYEGVGLIAAALLAELPDWALNEALLQQLAMHPDIVAPLLALQALIDAGRDDLADGLRSLLSDRLLADGGWTTLPESQVMSGTSLRALIDLSRDFGNDDDHMALISNILAAETADYSARMAALLELRDLLPFEDYRAVVEDEYQRAQADEPTIWLMGVEQLSHRLEGPVEVHAGTPLLTVTDVHVMTAHEYPTRYEDLALWIEALSRAEDSQFGHGVTEALQLQITAAHQFPLSDSEAAALQRIEQLLPRIEESDVTGMAPPPPPGI